MTVALTLIGIALNAVMLRDIFHTLFAPSGTGALSSGIARLVWRVFRRTSRSHAHRLVTAGPIALVLIIVVWASGLVLAWAFILWPHLPQGFLLSSGMDPDNNAGFLDAVYVSLVALATLGYGEITPQTTWLRGIAPLESLIGFALFTASISWIMSIYPALGRRRHLAREIALVERVGRAGYPLESLQTGAYCAQLRDFTSLVVTVHDDLVQFPIIYFFRTANPISALPVTLPCLVAMARTAVASEEPSVRMNGLLLLEALQNLTEHLAMSWLHGIEDDDIDGILDRYALDHLQDREALPTRLDSMESRGGH